MSTITRDMKICDDCSLVPYDMGIGVVREWDYEDLDEFDAAHARGLKEQIAFMVEHGTAVAADHACSLNTEPELYEEYGIMCDCACNPRRFEQQRDWAKKQRSNK
jgi:hypothetical protein